MINVCIRHVSGLDSPMIICRMVLPITFVRKWRKEEEPARVFIAPQGINSSVPAPISLSEGEEASYGSFAISAPAECCNLSHCHDATTLALDGPLQFTVWLFHRVAARFHTGYEMEMMNGLQTCEVYFDFL